MNRLTPRTMHELPIDERDAAEELLDMAVAWRKGDLPLGVVAAYGPLQVNGHGSPGFTRHKTFMYSGGDPRRDSLHALIETLDDLSGRVRTRQGNYSRQELWEWRQDVERFHANTPEGARTWHS